MAEPTFGSAAIGRDRRHSTGPATTAAQGDIAYETQEFNTGASRAYDQAGIGMLNWSGQVSDGFYRGSVLLPETAATATGVVGSALNFGATTAGEAVRATERFTAPATADEMAPLLRMRFRWSIPDAERQLLAVCTISGTVDPELAPIVDALAELGDLLLRTLRWD